jgi:Mn2+/Fe2+ NRAMP family transporter
VGGLLLPVLLVFVVRLSSDRRIMGNKANGIVGKLLMWAIIVIVAILAIVLLAMQILGTA